MTKNIRCYECIILVQPGFAQGQIEQLTNKYCDLIKACNGEIITSHYCGLQSLAYAIGSYKKAHYVQIDFKGTGAGVKELERNLQNNQSQILRYMTTVVDQHSEITTLFNSDNVGITSLEQELLSENTRKEKGGKCFFSQPNAPAIDYKNTALLSKFISESGKILPRRSINFGGLGISQNKQKRVATAIKRARILSLLGFEVNMDFTVRENIYAGNTK